MYKQESPCPQRRRTPSFSSTLLDAIYRSIDESKGAMEEEHEEEEVFGQYKEATTIKKQSLQSNSVSTFSGDALLEERKESSNLRRAIMIESWIEKQSTTRSYTTSSSSDSGCGGRGEGRLFSSSENESNSKANSRRSSSSLPANRTKPDKQQNAKCTGTGFTKTTKLRAMEIYKEFKKVKQPISPGGRIASFINSIFNSGSPKKVKMCSIGAMEDVSFNRKSKSASPSVTSFSRSCLIKTPPYSSRAKSSRSSTNNETKRSVTFYPVSVIVGEDSRPCGHKCIYEDDPCLMPRVANKRSSMNQEKVVVRKGEDCLRRYQQKYISKFDTLRAFRGFNEDIDNDDSDDGDDDDDESCSSSDLFELDHLIGIARYREELPVYETTNLKTNQAIANGYIL